MKHPEPAASAARGDKAVALVTGAATGIGLAIAKEFAKAGYQTHICDVDPEAVDALRASSPDITASVCDVSDPADVDALFDDLAGHCGRLDVLVNNAGIAGPTGPVETLDVEDWDRTIAVDLSGAFYCTRRAVPLLRAGEKATILNIASSAAFFGYPLRSPYAAAKWALIGLTKTLAMELGPRGIRVNAICPGSVDGPRIDSVIAADAASRGLTDAAIRDAYLRQTSMRQFIDAEDVAKLALFLASPDARYVAGQVIGVDGHTESLSNWTGD